MAICMIAAVGKNLELGKGNDLIWHFKDDMAFFKETTMGSSVIMGRKTFESLPKALPRRKNIVITTRKDYEAEGATVVNSIENALKEVDSDNAFIIGGGDIYKQFLPMADKLYLTEIEAECDDAQVFFPAFNKDEYDNYTIEEIVNRKNTLKKLSIDRATEKYKNGKEQILASNVDIVFIVISLNNDFNIARLERLVLLGNKANSKIAFILTKSDLCSIKDRENYRKIIEERFNYPVFIISSYNKEGIDDLKSVWKENETAVFIGSSGVGKSTLINTLLDNSEIRTNDIRHKDDKGKQTTTSRNLYILKDSRIVIDEPGIRSVASNDMNSDLNVVFSKIIELSKECKYTTCTHENIKVCRILQAIENGEISQEEFNRYKKLQSKEYRKNSNFLRKN